MVQIQFHNQIQNCLRPVPTQVQEQEQTQELRLSEGMPDVGRVLCAWGQVLIRSKQWQGDSVSVGCGVTVQILYAPEDGGPAQSTQVFIPFTLNWDLPPDTKEGYLEALCLVKSVDARSVSSRRLMVRATVSARCQVFSPWEAALCTPEEVPCDVQLLWKTYPVQLIREAGEKVFLCDEELTVPPDMPQLEKLVRCSLQPQVTEQKLLGDKVVFRGNTVLNMLYRTPEGAIQSWETEIPFSQYGELEHSYAEGASVRVNPMVTSLEAEADGQGRIRLKAGMSGQYLVWDKQMLSFVADAYSTKNQVAVQWGALEIPCVLEQTAQLINAEQTASFGGSRVVDTVFCPSQPQLMPRGEEKDLDFSGVFTVLYYDNEGILQGSTARWEGSKTLPADPDTQLLLTANAVGKPQGIPGEDTTALRGQMGVGLMSWAMEEYPAAVGITLEPGLPKDPQRPSLILRRVGNESLWEIAKENGSTVEAIQAANGMDREPEKDTMLLIPIL